MIFIKTFNLAWERNLFYCSQFEEIHIQGSTYYWLVIIYTNLQEIWDLCAHTNSIAKAKVYVSPIIAPNSQSMENKSLWKYTKFTKVGSDNKAAKGGHSDVILGEFWRPK